MKSSKKITVNFEEYQADLQDSKNNGFNSAAKLVSKAVKLANAGNKADAYEILADLLDYQDNEELEKLLEFEAPSFCEEDVPF